MAEDNNQVGTIESVLSGIVSGAIAIPKGLFSLGATLVDLGAGTDKAAGVEQWFDDLTEFDEKAEATAAGKIAELLVNIGLPGGYGFSLGSKLASKAMQAGKTGTLVKANSPKLAAALDKMKASQSATKLTAGALTGGVAEGVFVGDVKDAGSLVFDLDEEDDPGRELLNRVKFGTEGALFTGILGGVGKGIKKMANRNKDLDINNNKLDRWIDKAAGSLRSRGMKTQEFFDEERLSIGLRAGDASAARNISHDIDVDIDKMFTPMKTIFNKQNKENRNLFLKDVSRLLMSGTPDIDNLGRVKFGALDKKILSKVSDKIKKFTKNSDEAVEVEASIAGNLSLIRTKWGNLFTKIGGKLSKEEMTEFKSLFSGKFENYLGSTYDIFQNKSLIPWLSYTPTAEAVEKTKAVLINSAKVAGKELTDLEADDAVARILKTAKMPAGFRMDKPSDAIFEVPSFFVNQTTLKDAASVGGRSNISLGALQAGKDGPKEALELLLGKQSNPMQTILGGTAKLSLIARRNQFFDELIKKSDELTAAGKEPMFVKNVDEARLVFGDDFKAIEVIDPGGKLSVSKGATNPFADAKNPLFARPGVADALKKTSMQIEDSGTLAQMYQSLVLYPKATSQIAKTILSPVTHMRNFVSAGAFAAANGIIPGNFTATVRRQVGKNIEDTEEVNAIKMAYQALQTPLRGTRQQNELYEKLLNLGVVNSNVKLGDLSRLMEDVNFGQTMSSDKGMRMLLKPLSKLKSVSQDMYTAEDDFWKIYSWAVEQSRMEKRFENIGVTRGKWFKNSDGEEVRLTQEYLEERAADIVRNNIPNYDYVSEFIKGLRKLPIGNFVSFPAEIARTGTNIIQTALKEISEEVIVDGKVFKPFARTGYTRLFGFATTVAAVPYATSQMFGALYDITDEERGAIKRYVADWSKNSTLLPIRNKNGSFSYVDFSHANAYDTLIRPIQTVINSVADGEKDNDGIMNDFIGGTFEAMKEFASPFISEAIWTEAVLDILARGGKTREGYQVFNPEDNGGDKASKIMKHLVEAQMPFSMNQIKRMDRAIESVDVVTEGKYDKYGQTYEVGPEMAGLFGFRPVEINAERVMNFKIADFQKGQRDSRSLFTRETLKGGPVEPNTIVDAYINANRALFGVKQNMKKDMEAGEVLGLEEDQMSEAFSRVSNKEYSALREGIFVPFLPSDEVKNAFAINADKLGLDNPYDEAGEAINEIYGELLELDLDEGIFPSIDNPLLPIMQDTPITPTTLNLPNVESSVLTQQNAANQYSNLTMDQKIRLLFPNG
jgi:hypothetical protein